MTNQHKSEDHLENHDMGMMASLQQSYCGSRRCYTSLSMTAQNSENETNNSWEIVLNAKA